MSYNFNSLPKEIQEKVNEYIELLMMKYEKDQKEKDSKDSDPKVSPRAKLFGIYKGKIKMSPDFDDPLPDFKEYM